MHKVSKLVKQSGVRYCRLYTEPRKYGRYMKYYGAYMTHERAAEIEQVLRQAGLDARCTITKVWDGFNGCWDSEGELVVKLS